MVIDVRALKNPAMAPPGPKTDLKKKLTSFAGVLETLIIFFMVMGGIFFGIFTPTEAAAGAFLTLLIAVIKRQLTWDGFIQSIASTTRISCVLIALLVCNLILLIFPEIALFLPNLMR